MASSALLAKLLSVSLWIITPTPWEKIFFLVPASSGKAFFCFYGISFHTSLDYRYTFLLFVRLPKASVSAWKREAAILRNVRTILQRAFSSLYITVKAATNNVPHHFFFFFNRKKRKALKMVNLKKCAGILWVIFLLLSNVVWWCFLFA